jgi:hypothetical protein
MFQSLPRCLLVPGKTPHLQWISPVGNGSNVPFSAPPTAINGRERRTLRRPASGCRASPADGRPFDHSSRPSRSTDARRVSGSRRSLTFGCRTRVSLHEENGEWRMTHQPTSTLVTLLTLSDDARLDYTPGRGRWVLSTQTGYNRVGRLSA